MVNSARLWFDGASHLAQSLAALAVVLALVGAAWLIRLAGRGLRVAVKGSRPENVLTLMAAAMATSVASTGMWHFFERTLGDLPVVLRAMLFGFMEVAVLAEALRARANVRQNGEAGIDGTAVWVLTIMSGTMSASEAGSVRGGMVRFTAPLVAAWLWERSLVPERRAAREEKPQHLQWQLGFKRLAVRFGLATLAGGDLGDVDAARLVDRWARAQDRADGASNSEWAARRARRARAALMQRARLGHDPRDLMAYLGQRANLDVLRRLGGDDALLSSEDAAALQALLRLGTGRGMAPAEPVRSTEPRQGDPAGSTGTMPAAVIPTPRTEQDPVGSLQPASGVRTQDHVATAGTAADGGQPGAAAVADAREGASVPADTPPGWTNALGGAADDQPGLRPTGALVRASTVRTGAPLDTGASDVRGADTAPLGGSASAANDVSDALAAPLKGSAPAIGSAPVDAGALPGELLGASGVDAIKPVGPASDLAGEPEGDNSASHGRSRIEELREQVAAEYLAAAHAGARPPSIRMMANEFSAAQSSIRTALDQLGGAEAAWADACRQQENARTAVTV